MSAADLHFLKLLESLKMERKEDRRQYEAKIRNKSIEKRKSDGVTWYPLRFKETNMGTGDRCILVFDYPSRKGSRHLFQVGSSASVFVQSGNTIHSINGIICKLKEDEIAIMLNIDDSPIWLDDGKIGIDLLFDESTYDQMEHMVKSLIGKTTGRIAKQIQWAIGARQPQFDSTTNIDHPQLNKSQNKALAKVAAAQDIGLIHGPPGTGKTTTLVASIKDIAQREKQVLVCAPSNAAVDLIIEKLHNENISVTRIGHPARVTEEIERHTLDAQITDHPSFKELKSLLKRAEELRRLSRQYKRNFGRQEANKRRELLQESRMLKNESRMIEEGIIYHLLDHATVIACTLIGANNQHLFHKRFKTVFIDESSQALEPAAWIAISKADRVIMTGDHLQLAPTVKSIEALSQGLGETIFERCIDRFDADVMLTNQYRMHPDIVKFSNQQFYKDMLTTDVSIQERTPLFEETCEFIDTAGCGYEETLNEETLSTFNKEEAHFTIGRLKANIDVLEDPTLHTYAIIAPYKVQVEMLRTVLRNEEFAPEVLKQISINSVDAFQGQERDLVLTSLTRSNAQGIIGFLAEEKRMNVAMTRAKHKLVIIGDSATLGGHDFFDKLITFYQEQGHYHSAFEYLY